jgi:hypothetical protein
VAGPIYNTCSTAPKPSAWKFVGKLEAYASTLAWRSESQRGEIAAKCKEPQILRRRNQSGHELGRLGGEEMRAGRKRDAANYSDDWQNNSRYPF